MMRLPKRIAEILKRKEEFLDNARTKLENTVLKLQIKLFEDVISEIIPQLDVKDGILVDNANNYRLVSQLDKLYETFNTKIIETVLPQINKALATITSLGSEYYGLVLTDLPARFEKILEGARAITDLKIGIRAEKLVRGGNLSTIIKIDPTDFKQLLSKAVSSQMNMRDFIGVIKENINGTEERAGQLDRQFRRFAYDTYQQYDASYNKKAAEEFGMRYFIYQGGLVKDSRDFCVCHNNKVFSIEEAETWRTWTPADCEYPPGYEVKAKDLYSTPGYMGYDGYDPLVDRGGYNCRHILGFISDDLAHKYRPDIE